MQEHFFCGRHDLSRAFLEAKAAQPGNSWRSQFVNSSFPEVVGPAGKRCCQERLISQVLNTICGTCSAVSCRNQRISAARQVVFGPALAQEPLYKSLLSRGQESVRESDSEVWASEGRARARACPDHSERRWKCFRSLGAKARASPRRRCRATRSRDRLLLPTSRPEIAGAGVDYFATSPTRAGPPHPRSPRRRPGTRHSNSARFDRRRNLALSGDRHRNCHWVASQCCWRGKRGGETSTVWG